MRVASLCLLLVFVFCACGDETRPSGESLLIQQESSAEASNTESKETAAVNLQDYFTAEMPGMGGLSRDPFADSAAPKKSRRALGGSPAPEPSLQGILSRNGEWIALISGQTLRVGQSVHGWTIQRISAKSVELVRNERRRTLNL